MKLFHHTQTFIGTYKNNFSAHIELYGLLVVMTNLMENFVPVVLNK